MKIKNSFKLIGVVVVTLSLVACGSSSSSSSNNNSGVPAMKLKATVLNTKTVVAAAPKLNALKTMLALFSGKEAVAAASNCATADAAKEYNLLNPLESVCLESAVIVYEKIELEQEGVVNGDEVEVGPFIVDLMGTTTGIAGSISIPVPVGTFNKMDLRIGDLDDRNSDDSIDSSANDDVPINVEDLANIPAALVGQSLLITGTAHDGTSSKPFSFKTNIEGRARFPITIEAGEPLVDDGSSLITYLDLSTGFSSLTYLQLGSNMIGDMSTKKCSDAGLDDSQQLACDIVKNIDLFDDFDDDGIAEVEEHRGDNHTGTGSFDDSGNRD